MHVLFKSVLERSRLVFIAHYHSMSVEIFLLPCHLQTPHHALSPFAADVCAHPQTARADPTTSRLQAELQAPALCRERLEVFCRRAAKEPARAPAAGGGSSRHTTCRATAPSDAPHPPSAAPASPREGGPGKHSTSTRRLHVTEEPTLSQEGTLQKHLTAKRLELLSSLRAAMR